MNRQWKTVGMALCVGVLLTARTALADGWPTSLAGTWSVVGNQSLGFLTITQFPGAAGSQCKPIRGTIYVSDAIGGFYCPGSGRLGFVRLIGSTTSPRQYWSGNLSQVVTGLPLRIGGMFDSFPHNNVTGTSGGSLGEYNFSATK